MKSQISRLHAGALALQPSTVLNLQTNLALFWQALIMFLLVAAMVVPGAAQGIYVSNDNAHSSSRRPYIGHTPISGGAATTLPLSHPLPSNSLTGGIALWGKDLFVPYTSINLDTGNIYGFFADTGTWNFQLPAPAPILNPEAAVLLEGKLFFISGYAIRQYDFATQAICTLVNYEPQRIAAYPGPAGTVNLFVTYLGWKPNTGSLVQYNVTPSTCHVNSTTVLVPGLNYPEGVAVSLDGNYVYFVIPNNDPLGNTGEIDLYDRYLQTTSSLVPSISGRPFDLALAGANGDGSSNLFVTLRDGVNGSNGAVGEYTTYGTTVNDTLINSGLDFPVGIAVTPGDGSKFCAYPPDGIVAWYSLDQGLPDLGLPSPVQYDLAKGNDAKNFNTYFNTGSKVANSLGFDGSVGYLEAGPSASLNMGTGDFSISAWIDIPAGALNGTYVILDERQQISPGKYKGYHFFLYNGELGLQLANGTTYFNYLSSFTVQPQGWHLVTVTVSRTPPFGPQGVFYLDRGGPGKTSTFTPLAGNLNACISPGNCAPLEIGRREAFGGGGYFWGNIDELQIYNNALNPTEVASIFDADKSGVCK